MKKSVTIFLQIIVVLLGLAVLAFMLWEPQAEGVNVGKTFFEIYFQDPFIICAYIASIPFFVGAYQVFKALSQPTAKAMRIIRRCGEAIVCFVIAGELWLGIAVRGTDDIAGGVFMGLLIIAGAGIVAIVAKKLESKLQNNA